MLFDCGTPRIFEEAKYNYVFRTAAHATMDNVALIRYMKSHNVKMDTFSAINQDYAWGQDSRADFVAAAGQLYPEAKLGSDLLPKFGAGQYGTEISALVTVSRSERPSWSTSWRWKNGSSRPPKRDRVLRTPFAIAEIRPRPGVYTWRIRSASP